MHVQVLEPCGQTYDIMSALCMHGNEAKRASSEHQSSMQHTRLLLYPQIVARWDACKIKSSMSALCRPDAADQTYSTAHLAQAQGKFCSMRHLAEPLHVDVSGR